MNNNLAIEIWNGNTRIDNLSLDVTRAQDITFSTQYPGGLFGTCDFFIPRSIVATCALSGANMVVVRNNRSIVFQGYIANLPIQLEEALQGRAIHAVGAWAAILMTRRWRKPFADTRLDDATWLWQTNIATWTGVEKCSLDRNNRLRFTPKREAWINNDWVAVVYIAPVGETVKRITFNYDLQKAAQSWMLGLWNVGTSASVWSVAVSGTGTVDHTLATPNQEILFYFKATASQTPASDGTIYGEVSNLVVYTETGAINLSTIATKVAAKDSRLSTDTSLIAASALSLVPFITDGMSGYATLADILDKAAKYGDSSYNSWAVGVREGDLSGDGKPILFAEIYPALTGYDYAVRVEEPTFTPPFEVWQDFDDLWNYIFVLYQDANGRTAYLTPTDDAGLTDATSVAAYGQRDYLLQVNTTSSTVAANAGKRFLAAKKDPTWRVNGNITIKGSIRTSTGNSIPACQIRAGKRIKIENWLNDLSGTGLTFLITGTTYMDADQTCQISVGQADPLDVLLAQLSMGK